MKTENFQIQRPSESPDFLLVSLEQPMNLKKVEHRTQNSEKEINFIHYLLLLLYLYE